MSEQLPIDFARARRDGAIEQVYDNAEALHRGWKRGAREYLLDFLAIHAEPFLAEDVREYAERRGFSPPHDPRAWGGVFQAAARENLVRKVGYAPARSSNLSPKVQWARN